MDNYLLQFKESYKKIRTAKNSEVADNEIEKLYKYTKDITPEFFRGDNLSKNYRHIKRKLIECESVLPKDFIIESDPIYEFDMFDLQVPVNESFQNKLDWAIYMTRRYLHIKNSISKRSLEDFNRLDLANFCELASKRFYYFCQLVGIECKVFIIDPGYTSEVELFNGYGYHFINAIKNGNEQYIVDTTYRQFFTLKYNNLERLGIVDISGCRPGVFMLMTKKREILAREILKKGYFKVTKDNLKNYLDGFTLSFRNGLYYIDTNDYSYTTNYTATDYVNFLNGEDNQLNYEREELLGFQRTLKPTKDKK